MLESHFVVRWSVWTSRLYPRLLFARHMSLVSCHFSYAQGH